MYGWRAKIGVVGGGAAEGDFPRMIPEGVQLYFQKFPFKNNPKGRVTGVDDLKQPLEVFAEAAAQLTRVRPASMTLNGTGLSFCGGFGWDQQIIAAMRAKNGNIPTTTSSTSVVTAVKKMGIRKISLAMPYLEDVALTAVKFFQDYGLEIVKYKWLGYPIAHKGMADISREELYNLAREVNDPESEALVISCVEIYAIDLIQPLETDLQKPVITANQATIWNLMRMAGVNEKIQGFGQLLVKY
jgi:maleate isomerase